ncbi:MAG: hypothetical protein ACI4MY_01475 [Christensenellales bacterium]
MKDVNKKIAKLKALIIKEQKLLLDVLATMTRQDKSVVDGTVDTQNFTSYNAILAKQLQLLSRVFNQQIKKQSLVDFDRQNVQNSIRIDDFDDNREPLHDHGVETTPTISLEEDSGEEPVSSDSEGSHPNIR